MEKNTVYVYIYIYIYTYIYTYIYIHTHTYTFVCVCVCVCYFDADPFVDYFRKNYIINLNMPVSELH